MKWSIQTSENEAAEPETANDRFKRGFGSWVWFGLILATLLHAALFLTAPTFSIQDFAVGARDLSVMEFPDEIDIPPPPEAIPRPAEPVIVADARIDEDLTIAPTTLERNPVENLPPPPKAAAAEKDLSSTPVFTPMTVRPTLKNSAEVMAALSKYYPPLLKDAGIGGSVLVWFFIDEEGRVVRTQIHRTSGYDAFDNAALRVAELMEFTPAYNREMKVRVWVSIPITFESR